MDPRRIPLWPADKFGLPHSDMVDYLLEFNTVRINLEPLNTYVEEAVRLTKQAEVPDLLTLRLRLQERRDRSLKAVNELWRDAMFGAVSAKLMHAFPGSEYMQFIHLMAMIRTGSLTKTAEFIAYLASTAHQSHATLTYNLDQIFEPLTQPAVKLADSGAMKTEIDVELQLEGTDGGVGRLETLRHQAVDEKSKRNQSSDIVATPEVDGSEAATERKANCPPATKPSINPKAADNVEERDESLSQGSDDDLSEDVSAFEYDPYGWPSSPTSKKRKRKGSPEILSRQRISKRLAGTPHFDPEAPPICPQSACVWVDDTVSRSGQECGIPVNPDLSGKEAV